MNMKRTILMIIVACMAGSLAMAQNALYPAVRGNYAGRSTDAQYNYYNEKRTKLLQLDKLSCGVIISRSFRNEGVLGYDSVKHALVYNESMKSIWDQTYREIMELTKSEGSSSRWTLREKPRKPWAVPVAYHQLHIPDDLASDLRGLWTNAILAARTDTSQITVLDGTLWDVFVRGANPMYARTNGCASRKAPEGEEYLVRRLLRLNRQLIEAVKKGNRRALEALRIDIKFLADDFRHDATVDDNGWKFRHAF
jgi:opacity protein-like surface antigen